MRRWIAILAAAVLALLLTSCGGDEAPQPTAAPTEPPPQLHTVAPTQAQPEIEWVYVDAAMTLEDADNVYAQGRDFVSFALIGTGDDAEIRFKLDDVTAEMLREQDPDNAYYVTMNEKKLCSVTLNEKCDELTLVLDYSYDKLCDLANRIRGLK